MSQYRRVYLPGGTIFLTLVTHQRLPLFANAANVAHLRSAVATIKAESPFEILGAVVLPDHLHFVWQLPPGDSNYSKRIGQIKVLLTRSLQRINNLPTPQSDSRRKHREREIWQRRFWEHTIRDSEELTRVLDYIYFNPVKHGWVSCPHLWTHSSFGKGVKDGHYRSNWACQCNGGNVQIPDFQGLSLGEWGGHRPPKFPESSTR